MRQLFLGIFYTVLTIMVSGCDNGKSRIFYPFCQDMRAKISPHSLQEWAKPLVKKDFELDQIEPEIWPTCIKKMGENGPTQCFKSEWEYSNSEALVFLWGSGVRHWGLIMGDEQFKIDNNPDMHVEEWISGVYFFIDM